MVLVVHVSVTKKVIAEDFGDCLWFVDPDWLVEFEVDAVIETADKDLSTTPA